MIANLVCQFLPSLSHLCFCHHVFFNVDLGFLPSSKRLHRTFITTIDCKPVIPENLFFCQHHLNYLTSLCDFGYVTDVIWALCSSCIGSYAMVLASCHVLLLSRHHAMCCLCCDWIQRTAAGLLCCWHRLPLLIWTSAKLYTRQCIIWDLNLWK